MKLINNRFKIKELIITEEFEEGYLALDLANNNKKSLLKLYEFDKNINVVKYYIENFIEISQIKHKSLLQSYSFNLVESLNLKRNNAPFYYTTAEYLERPVYRSLELSFTLEEALIVILDLMSVIDFLHFRGFVYKYLNPTTTFYSHDKQVKIVDLSTISEYKINCYYDDSIEGFTAPESFNNINNNDNKADYYSLGMMMKHLLLKDHLVDAAVLEYKEHFNLDDSQILFLTNIINNLTNKEPSLRNINLRTHIDNIIEFFNLNYTYDLLEERKNFYSKTKIVGRDKEIQRLLPLDSNYNKRDKNYDLAIISGDVGDGKTKLLHELFYKLKINGLQTYFIEIKENSMNSDSNIVSLLKETFKNTPSEILNKYNEDFNLILQDDDGLVDNKVLNFKVEKFKLLNRIANYFKDISKNKKIYIIIDNFHKAKDDFISVLDYIISNNDNNELSIIIGLEKIYENENTIISETLNRWKSYNTVIDLKLEKLNEEDIGKLTKSILGISYIPKRFSSILFKGSQGNPLYLEYIIKYLFNKGELYINDGGHWSLKTEDYSILPIPTNINKAIEEQLNRIKKDELEVLKAISIFSERFTKELLIKILEMDRSYVEIILDNLIAERFIEKYDDYSYGITPNGWQRIIYSRINNDEKEFLHNKVAKVIMDEYGENSSLVLEELVLHLVKGKDKEKALRFIFKEWDKLENKYGDQSIYLCEEAYKIIQDTKDRNKLILLDRLVDIYSVKGNIEKSAKYLSELTELSNLQENVGFQIKAMVYKSSEYLRENNVQKAYEIAIRVENISRDNNITEGIINAQIIKCRILLDNKELHYIENLLNEAKELSDLSHNEKYLGTIYNLFGIANNLEGNTEVAISYYKESIEHSIDCNNMLEATKPMNNLAEIYSLNHGNIDMALYYYKRGLEIANLYGFTEISIIFLNNLGELYKNSGDMDRALELFEESRKGAIKIGDYNMIFLANANLGLLYLSYNMMDKVYDCFIFLENEYKKNPINEIEILTQYNMFLGEYYEAFGKPDLAIEYFSKVLKACKGYNIRDYLRAKIKIVFVEYMGTLKINQQEVDNLIEELTEAKLYYDRQKFLLYLSILLYLTEETDFSNKLLKLYDETKVQLNDSINEQLRKCFDYLKEDKENGLEKIEIYIEEDHHLQQSVIRQYIYTTLGKEYFGKKNYLKSTKHLLKALDLIYLSGGKIPKVCLFDQYIKTRDSIIIKESITEGLQKILKNNWEYQLETLCDLSKLMESLPNKIVHEIFHSESQIKTMDSLETMVSNLTKDFDKNIDLILNYMSYITIANRGHILKFDENSSTYISIASLVKDDNDLPNENILIQSNKNNLGLLLNKNFEDTNKNRFVHYFQSDSIGIICVPINIPIQSNKVAKDRRKRVYSANQNNKGYIYLETQSSLNRFDLDMLKLINSLSYLLYLNIENNNLTLISSVDKLTNIFTRKYFEQRFTEILSNLDKTNESFTILMLDIDNFKSVNDTYGHLKGDEVLAEVAKTIKDSIRKTDLVGRYGGEEFIVLLNDSNVILGKEIAEKIRVNIEQMKIPGINRKITVSIGLSQYPNHSQVKEELINKADQALYYSKNYLNKNSTSCWSLEMSGTYNRIDKLAGVLTGNTNLDNRNLLTIQDMVELSIEQKSFKEKTYLFLGRTLDTIDGEYATLLLIDDEGNAIPYGSRIRLNSQWVKTPIINMEKINDIIERKIGDFLIDWDGIESISPITGVPNWQSVMIIPLTKQNVVKGILYISVPLDEKEFEFNSFNLTKFLCNIYASNL